MDELEQSTYDFMNNSKSKSALEISDEIAIDTVNTDSIDKQIIAELRENICKLEEENKKLDEQKRKNFKDYQDEMSKRMHYQYAFETVMEYLLKYK